jgi:hypothetical protein
MFYHYKLIKDLIIDFFTFIKLAKVVLYFKIVANDNEFDVAVQHDLEVLKQFWAEEHNTREKQFTPVISKNQKKRDRK